MSTRSRLMENSCPNLGRNKKYWSLRLVAWKAAAAAVAQDPRNVRAEIPKDDDVEINDDQKLSYHRAHTATIAPFLLGMSGLGGAMIRKSNKRRMSDFTDIEHLANQAEGMHLTQRHAEQLRTTWRDITTRRSQLTPGEWVFNKMLQDYPMLTEAMQNTKAMHAKALTSALDMAMESLDCLDDSLGPLFVEHGTCHARLEMADKFRTDFWELFSDALCDYALSWKLKAGNRMETLQAWRVLILFVMKKLKQGHTNEVTRLRLRLNRESTMVNDNATILSLANNSQSK